MFHKVGTFAVIFTWNTSLKFKRDLSLPHPFNYGNITAKRPYLKIDFNSDKDCKNLLNTDLIALLSLVCLRVFVLILNFSVILYRNWTDNGFLFPVFNLMLSPTCDILAWQPSLPMVPIPENEMLISKEVISWQLIDFSICMLALSFVCIAHVRLISKNVLSFQTCFFFFFCAETI